MVETVPRHFWILALQGIHIHHQNTASAAFGEYGVDFRQLRAAAGAAAAVEKDISGGASEPSELKDAGLPGAAQSGTPLR